MSVRLLLFIAGCASGPGTGSGDTENTGTEDSATTSALRDLVVDYGALEGGEVRFFSPVYEIPPYTDVTWCAIGTWTGATMGVTQLLPHQGDFGHHLQLNALNDLPDAPADGEFLPCEDLGELDGGNLYRPAESLRGGQVVGGLPDGMAMYLPTGQRWIMQSHYINTTADRLRVQDAIDAQTLAADAVGEWVAAFVMGTDALEIGSGRVAVRSECIWDAEAHFLSFSAHMHDHGVAFLFEMDQGGGWQTLYETAVWEDSWANAPETLLFEKGAFPVAVGDRFAVTCTWENDSGETLRFPSEMCNVQGLFYSSQSNYTCNVTEPERL